MKLVTTSLIGLLVASPLLAQEPVTRERQHVVKTGDTLWDLAGAYLSNPFRWRVIYEANTTVVEDPHWIYPDEVLVIPGMTESVLPAAPPPMEPAVAVRPVERPARTVFYRAELETPQEGDAPTVLREPVLESLPVKPGEFTSAEFLAIPDRLPRYGRMIKPKRETTRLAGVIPTAHPKDEVYLTNESDAPPAVGERLLLVDVDRSIPAAGVGYHVMVPTAVIQVLEVTPEVIRGRVESQFDVVQEDQLLMPMARFPDFLVAAAEPVPGGSDLRGQLIQFVDDQPLYGRADRAFLDLGSRHGVAVGDIFLAYLAERPAREERTLTGIVRSSETLPPEGVAELRVVRVTDGHATVKVDRLMLPRLENGMWVQRIRKMP